MEQRTQFFQTAEKVQREQSAIKFYSSRLAKLNTEINFINNLIKNFPDTNRFNVVSIGFGKYPIEIPALEELAKQYNFSFTYYGFEVNSKKLDFAKTQYADNKNINFHLISGTDEQKIRDILNHEPVHIVIMRHPVLNPENNEANAPFRAIFTQTIPAILAEGGCLLTSIYNDPEAESYRALMTIIGCTEYIELEKQEYIFWKTERSTQQWGYDNFSTKAVDLYAEKYFFAVVDFRRSHFLQMEHNNVTFDQSFANQLCDKLTQMIVGKPKGYLPIEKNNRDGYILLNLTKLFAAHFNDFAAIKDGLESLNELIKIMLPGDFYDTKDLTLAHVQWLFMRWSEQPENQKIILYRICNAFVQLSTSIELQKQSEVERQKHYLGTLKLVAERPVPSELSNTYKVGEVKANTDNSYYNPAMYW